MSAAAAHAPDAAPPSTPTPAWLRPLHRLEEALVVLPMAAMVLLPLLEAALRGTGVGGITGAPAIVQHCVLAVCMLGAALAARRRQLLSLASLQSWMPPAWRAPAQLFGLAVGAAVSAGLAIASAQYVASEREVGKELAYGVQLWCLELVQPVGFALIAARLVWMADSWGRRACALALAAALVALFAWGGIEPEQLRWPGVIGIAIAVALGAPLFVAIGGTALVLFWADQVPIVTLPIDHYKLATNSALPALPLFTLVGYFLAGSGASGRLLRVFRACFSGVRGGEAVATACLCAFFTTFTGASGATILALGGLLLPVLIGAGVRERPALGLLTGASSLGLLFPPCLPLYLYSFVAGMNGERSLSIRQMFLAGILPGFLLLGVTIAWGVWISPAKRGASARFSLDECRRALWAAKWELLVPVVAMVALFSGWATPIEAAAATALYAFAIETFVYRDITLRRGVPSVLCECGLVIGGVLLIMGVAQGLTGWLVDAQIPDRMVEWTTAHVHSPWLFLLLLNAVLLFVGGMMEIYAAIFVVVPVLVPLGSAYGIEPAHLGILFLANMELGFLAPPIGLNLLLASYRFQKSIGEVARASLPMLVVLIGGVLLITYVPWLSTWLPSRFPG